jgi:hypothetical protein
MVDARLTNLLDHCAALDQDRSAEQIQRSRQYAEIIAQSVPQMAYDFETCQPTEHPNRLHALIFRLALATYNYVDALSRLHLRHLDKWAEEYHEKAVTEWAAARREAEIFAFGSVRAATLLAIATA